MKVKHKNHNTYNIDNVNVEIDYDKLAKALVHAEKEANNKKVNKSLFRSKAMNFINGTIFIMVSLLAVTGIELLWKNCYSAGTISIVCCSFLTIILIFIAVYAFLCQQETFNDDSTDSINQFNTNIALIALVISMIALMKG